MPTNRGIATVLINGTNMPKLLILGHAQHGKDTAAEYLQQAYGVTFESSSLVACREFLWEDAATQGMPYATPEALYLNRDKHRQWMYEKIHAYNTPDRTALARLILKDHDCYCGMRHKEELDACKAAGLFDLILWIDASKRKPAEPSTSTTVTPDDADVVIDNNGAMYDLFDQLDKAWKTVTAQGAA
jgi:dephospho-CoA kinase